jgi:hypothetical protein
MTDRYLLPVCQHAMQNTTSLLDEKWDGSDEEELACFVTEVGPGITCRLENPVVVR